MQFGFQLNNNYKLGPVNPKDLREDVRKLYVKYRDKFKFKVPDENDYGNERRFYVYEWFTKDEEKIFYVGKGTGHRYNHILSDMQRSRGIYYKELQNNFGIDYRIIANNLTNLEAEIYEICWIHERTSQGEVLLQFVDMPYDFKSDKKLREKYKRREFIPKIEISKYRKRYFDITEEPSYDSIKLKSLLRSHFLSTNSVVSPYIGDEKNKIENYINSCGGRVYVTLAKSAKSVIEFGDLNYDRYCDLKEKDYEIYHSFHVLNFINNHPEFSKKNKKETKIRIPKYNKNKKIEIQNYLKRIEREIKEISNSNISGYQASKKGLDHKKNKDYKKAIKFLEASVRMKFEAPAAYLQLAIIYRKFGMFKKELNILKKATKIVSEDNTSMGKIKDRVRKVEKYIDQEQ